MHDYIHSPMKLPMSFNNLFTLQNRLTRNKLYVQHQKPRTQFSERLPLHSLPIVWNSLTNKLKQVQKINEFKKTYTRNTLDSYVDQLKCNNPGCKECHMHDRVLWGKFVLWQIVVSLNKKGYVLASAHINKCTNYFSYSWDQLLLSWCPLPFPVLLVAMGRQPTSGYMANQTALYTQN